MGNKIMFVIFTLLSVGHLISFVSVILGMKVDSTTAAGAYLLVSIFAGLFACGEWSRIRTKEESE